MDATVVGWGESVGGFDVVIFSNLLHLISEDEATIVLSESSITLNSSGVILIYGPFLRGDEFASEGDQKFDESLRSQDPEIGYKSFQDIQVTLKSCGLVSFEPIELPANNLLIVAQKT